MYTLHKRFMKTQTVRILTLKDGPFQQICEKNLNGTNLQGKCKWVQGGAPHLFETASGGGCGEAGWGAAGSVNWWAPENSVADSQRTKGGNAL